MQKGVEERQEDSRKAVHQVTWTVFGHSHGTLLVTSPLWTSEEGLEKIKSILALDFHDSKQHFDVLCKVTQICA